jgi:hypothetical protein
MEMMPPPTTRTTGRYPAYPLALPVIRPPQLWSPMPPPPRRPRSASAIFQLLERPRLEEVLIAQGTIEDAYADIPLLLTDEWNRLPVMEKEVYRQMARSELRRHQAEIKTWKAWRHQFMLGSQQVIVPRALSAVSNETLLRGIYHHLAGEESSRRVRVVPRRGMALNEKSGGKDEHEQTIR